ncbi:hypothetical protein ACWEP5_36385 [Nocardia niigatensis]
MSNYAEQQPNPEHEYNNPAASESRRPIDKSFLSSAAGSFVGRTLSDLMLKVVHHFWSWL